MIDAMGTITALDGEYALVRMDETGCGRCHEEGGCGGNNLGKMLCSSPRIFRVMNSGKSSVGDRVTISIAEGAVRRTAILAYGLPLLSLFVGAFVGLVVVGEVGAIVGSVIGLLGSWIALRYFQRSNPPDPRFEPYIKH
ncbi:MAG: SoxR reducing system RseC family protein [Betaproteobacteria bacterium]